MCPWLLEVPQSSDNRDGPWITWLWSRRTGQFTSKPGQRLRWGATCWPNPAGVISCVSHSSMSQCSCAEVAEPCCVPRQAPWHNSTSFSMPAPSYASIGSFLPSPSLIACSWTLATVCCSQCLWYNCLQNCEMSWVRDQQGQPGFWFLLKGWFKPQACEQLIFTVASMQRAGDDSTRGQGWRQDGWEHLQLSLLPKLAKQHSYISALLEALSTLHRLPSLCWQILHCLKDLLHFPLGIKWFT